MAEREIKTRFKLEGEQEFKRAMSDAANATKVLDSEMKLAKAQFEQTGDAQQYMAEQTRILKEKIEEQKSAVAAAQAAMNSLAANGVSKNDKTYQMWAQRLNTAKTTLVGLENQLTKAENGFEDVNTAAESTDSTLDSIDKEVRFQNTLKILENMRDRLNGIVRAAARAGKAIWDMETDAGKWADDLATAASQAGLDVETYQSWQYASRFIDTSVDDISKSIRKMEADLKSSSEDVLKTFNQLGVATRNADGSVRNANAVFFDTVDALGRVEDATKRGIYAQTLLGSHYNNLNPLIEAGSKAYEDMAEEGRRVAVVSEENVQKLGSLNDQQEQMNAVLEKTKMTLLSSLAEPFEKVSSGITNATMALNEFLESDEGKQALQELGEALDGLTGAFLGEDNGKGTFESIVSDATGAVNAFTGALTWIKDNAGTVKAGLIGIGAVWAGLNVAPPVLEALHLISKINWGSVSKGTAEATKAAESAASSAAADAAGGGHAPALAGSALTRAAAKAEVLALAAMAAETAVNVVTEAKEQGTVLGIGPGNTDNQGNWQLGQSGIYINNEALNAVKDGIFGTYEKAELGQQIYDAITAAVQQGMDAAEFTRKEYGTETLGQFYTARVGELNYTGTGGTAERAEMQSLYEDLTDVLEQLQQDMTEGGQEAAANLANAFAENAPQATEAAQQMGEDVNTTVEEEMSFMDVFGYNAAQGLAQGIYDGTPAAVQAAQEMANQVQSTIQSALDIHSPSRVLMRMGEFTAEGFAQGMDAGMERVERAAARMSRAAAQAPVYRSGGSWGADPAGAQASPAQGGGSSGSMNATILMDKTVVGRLVAPIVNEAIGAQVAAARRY